MTSKPQRVPAAARTPQPVYEDFKPTFRWREDSENHILAIDLPGFLKEQVRVSTEHQNIIRVRGERPVRRQNARNRRARFQEDFQVPENGDMDKMHAKFDGGALVITVRKKAIDNPQEAKFLKQDEIEHPSQPGSEKSLESTPGNPRMKLDLADIPTEGRRGTPFRDFRQVLPQDNKFKEEKHVIEKMAEKEEDTKTREVLPEAVGSGNIGLKAVNKASAATTGNEEDKKSKGKHKILTDGTHIGVSPTEKLNEAANELTKVNEEKQSLVNMGVAVLVIIALSSYATYQLALGKNKN